MATVVAFVQARMSSTRFPEKVLADLAGKPMIIFMLERVARAKRLDRVVLVTSTDQSDDRLADVVQAHGFACFRGSLDDVLGRFAAAAAAYPADVYVRLTGDCPLADPEIIDAVVEALFRSGSDYASNIDPPSFADGMDVECCTHETLIKAHQHAVSSRDREHVTLWMRDDLNRVNRTNHVASIAGAHLRLTVDYPDDLETIRRVVAKLGANCHYSDMLRLLQADSELAATQHERNEALKR